MFTFCSGSLLVKIKENQFIFYINSRCECYLGNWLSKMKLISQLLSRSREWQQNYDINIFIWISLKTFSLGSYCYWQCWASGEIQQNDHMEEFACLGLSVVISHLIMQKFTLINLTDRCHRSPRKLNQHFKFSGWFSSNLQFYSKSISDPSSLASLHFLSPIFFSFIIFLLLSMFSTPTHCRSL